MNSSSSAIYRRGFMFVLSSPSGAGKTTLSRLLLEEDENLMMSISTTTREKRPNEVSGRDYNFVAKGVFKDMIARDDFLEHAEVFGHLYGTPAQLVDESLDAGRDVLFDIDWQGTQQLAEKRPKDLVSIFILPPSMQELESRLRKRGEDSDEVIRKRMSKASDEISHWDAYDYVIINYDVEESLKSIKAVLRAERVKRKRQHGLTAFVEQELLGNAG